MQATDGAVAGRDSHLPTISAGRLVSDGLGD
jgi:hypothetical protein